MTFRSLRHLVGFVAVGAGITAVVAVLPRTESSLAVPPFVRAVTEVPNPEIADSCGTNVVLVLDASGSIESSGAVDEVRDAGEAFLDALADTGSTARVTQFASLSEELAPQAEVTAASLQPGGAFRTAINGYYNPKPPRPSNVNIFSYNGSGNPQSSNNWRAANSSNQFTNWDQSLDQAGEIQPEPVELVVYVTDGDPTAYDFNQAGDPFDAGPPPDVGVNTNRGSANSLTLDRAVDESNLLQAANTRILAVGVGSALDNPNSQSRLEQISGPKVIRDADLDATNSINDVDVALVREFDKLAQFLRGVVSQLCSPSLSIRKLAQTPGSAEYLPAEDWDITVAPSVDSPGTFEWILPDTDPVQTMRCGSPDDPNDGASRTCATDNVGLANFQWEPNPTDAATSATVVETLKPNYTAGRPDDADYRCQVKDINGNVTVVEGELNQGNGFSLDVDSQDIITCSIYNSFDYAPDITLTKVDDPLQVRGDLAPPANTVTSTFVATNTGNAVLDQVTLTDDRCNPVGPSDDDGDGLLGIGESWTFTCTRNLTSSPGASPNLVVNNAEVTGVDPAGTLVSATADATVTAYAPAIALSKSADADQVQVGIDTDVEYTYVATNTGNMTLTDVTVVDSAGPSTCAPVTPASVATLAPGATTTFTCTTTLNPGSPQDTFVNTATVTGDPIFP